MDKKWRMKVGGVSRYSVKSFLCQSTEKLRDGNLLCFTTTLVLKRFIDKMGGGRRERVSRFSIKSSSVSQYRKLSRGTFLCFTKLLASKI